MTKPILYISRALLSDTSSHGTRVMSLDLERIGPLSAEAMGLIPLEQAVPRCDTCEHFREDQFGLFCAKLNDKSLNAKTVRRDGYCDEHPEASRP